MYTIKKIIDFVTSPRAVRIIGIAAVVLFILMFLRQCDKIDGLKNQIELEKKEVKRVSNNYRASQDTIIQYKLDKDTWVAKRSGYEIKIDELNGEYSFLLGKFEFEKNKPPKTIIKTEYIIEERVVEVPVFVETDESGNTALFFKDSTRHDSLNFRTLNGSIPYTIVFNKEDSTYDVVPGLGRFNMKLGMDLNLGLFKNKETGEIKIVAHTNYPGITFTNIEGASIMEEPESKKMLRQARKPWSIGLNLGYGATVDNSLKISHGPYMGIGLSYSPKFLQWGK